MNTDRYCDRVSELVERGFTGGEMPSQWRGIVSVVEDMGLSVTRVRHDTFAVYKPDEHFIRGTIGYGNYFDFSEADNPDRFMVGARHIRNGRYSAQSRQHTMRLSKNLDTAAKAARTYLTPVSVQEITRFYLESIQRAHNIYQYSLLVPFVNSSCSYQTAHSVGPVVKVRTALAQIFDVCCVF